MHLKFLVFFAAISTLAWAQGVPVSFTLPIVTPTAVPLLAVTPVDLNNDGKLDFVATNNTNQFCSALGNGDGTFQPLVCLTLSKSATRLAAPVIADFNGDGIPDAAVSLFGYTGEIQILYGLGDGSFQLGASLDASPLPTLTDLKVADFNHDGIPDLVACAPYNAGSPNPQREMRQGIGFFEGKGNGTFSAMYRVPTSAAHFALGDFNQDGKLDIAVPAKVILLGNGGFSFTRENDSLSPNIGVDAFAIDVNGDKKLDLAIPDKSGNLYLDVGKGDGTFLPTVATTVTNGTVMNGATADFNFDGYADLVLSTPGNLVFAIGDPGGFLTIVTIEASNITSVSAGDFNGDGKADILYTFTNSAGQISVAVLLNTLL